MMLDRAFVMSLVGFVFFAGCTAKRVTDASVVQPISQTDPLEVLSDDDLDASTGVVVPSGPGLVINRAHVMTPEARGSYNEGVREGMAGNLDKSEKAFRRALDIDPAAYEAEYNIGVLFERRGDDQKALQKYLRALSMQPDYTPAVDAVSRFHIRSGNASAAVAFMSRKASDFPRSVSVLTRYADALSASRRYSDAIEVAKQALRLDERNAQAMVQIGKANLFLGRTELAQSILAQVIQIDPDIAETYFLLGLIAQRDNNRAEALQQLEAATLKNPTHVESINNLAVQFMLSGNYEKAIQHLENAVALSPSWAVLYSNYGNALRGAGRWEDARVSLEKARTLDGRMTEVLFNLGVLYFAADQMGEMDRLSRLKESQRYFLQYRNALASSLTEENAVHRYSKEVSVLIQREEQRLAQERKQAELDNRRVAEKEIPSAISGEDGRKVPVVTPNQEDDEDWE